MPRSIRPPVSRDDAAQTLDAVAELLELLWGRGQEAAPSGPVPPSQLRALIVIEQGGSMNLRSLGDALASRPSSVSRLCDRMEAVGLIRRAPSTTSRREVEVVLSPLGEQVLRELRDHRAREVRAVLEQMSSADVARLTEGLEAFRVTALDQLDERGGGSGREPGRATGTG
ncbi:MULTISPECIES: MarR family transcriptional regulator [unclassified Streptomyces]|uniref:MarR family winged helix-turn-helix transcriptional regulator n=1 Tax=unclassified Streptomyces TaxID=2593676 RepID=UPI0033A34D9E|nr:MarR family transcriptional regulator [Streptomyces sp. NBC_01176]